MNTRLLRKVKKAILEHPENTDMGYWVKHDDSLAECGTVGCIAGWVWAKADIENLRKLPQVLSWDHRALTSAKRLLDIGSVQANSLFYVANWPSNFERAFNNRVTRQAKARIVADRIDHFIKTKGEE